MNDTTGKKITDKQLVERVLKGDNNAFGMIIQQTEGLVTQIVFKMVSRKEDHKDIAQDIYLKAYKNLPGFKFQSLLSTWIASIAYNTCLNYLEKKKLVLVIDDDEKNEEHANSDTLEEYERLFQKDLNEILKMSIDQLQPLYKTLIILYHKEELSYRDISLITNLPEGTVKNYLFRARKSLKEIILQQYKKDEL